MRKTWNASARRFVYLLTAITVLCPLYSISAEAPKREPIYDAKANPKQQVAEAIKNAKKENKRVLIQFGANWCPWCYKMHDLFKENVKVGRTLRSEYELVLIDTDAHTDYAKSLGADIENNGIPYLTVLDTDGKVLTHQESVSLEEGENHSPDKVLAFLNKWRVPPQDAHVVFNTALEKAKTEKKKIFLILGAGWCPDCRNLDSVLNNPEVKTILAQDYLITKIDVQRMDNAIELYERFNTVNQSIPLTVILDENGKVLTTSFIEGKGNVSFPTDEPKVEHFLGMIKQTASTVTPEQISTIKAALVKKGEEIQAKK